MALLLAPPVINRTYSASQAILLTPGYHPDSLRSLLTQLRPMPQVYHFDSAASEGVAVTDFTAFREQYPAVQTLHVLGNGLEEEELTRLKAIRLVPHLSKLPAGVLSASWPQRITLGEEVQVQGKFTAPGNATTLYLQAAGGRRDSVEIKKGIKQNFALRFIPKTSGQFVFALQWKGEEDSVHQEAIPIMVQEPRLLNVLLLSSAPSFEVKFLKNALAQQGHGVAVRSQVSKGIYQTELVNLSGLNLNRLSEPLLQKFDVVLLDGATLQGLSGQEKQVLQKAVRQQGLGIMTSFSENSPKRVPFFAEGVLRQISQKQARNAPVQWTGQTKGPVLAVSGKVLQPQEGQQALAWEKNPQQALVVHYRKGLGQVGVSLVSETFPLALEGKENLYQHFWANVLTTLAKPIQENSITQEPAMARVHQPLLVEASAGNVMGKKAMSAASGKTLDLVSAQGSLLPGRQVFTIWPQEKGWHSLALKEGNASLYVYPQTSRQTQQLQNRQKATLAATAQTLGKPHAMKDVTRPEAFPLWPFGLGLLLALGFLWLEEKI